MADSGAAAPVIDWGDAISSEGPQAAEGEGGGPTINWDNEVEDEGTADAASVASIEVVDEEKKEGGDKKKKDEDNKGKDKEEDKGIPLEFKNANLSETMLENALLRNRLLNDVTEVCISLSRFLSLIYVFLFL